MPVRTPQPGPFQAEMPRIPGVNDAGSAAPQPKPVGWEIAGSPRAALPRWAFLACAAALAIGLGLWALHASRSKRAPEIPSDAETQAAPVGEVAEPANAARGSLTPSGATIVASVGELSKPWAAKRFTFVNPLSHENVPAMIVRLPAGTANRREGYWAFSLKAPFKTCELNYLPDLAQLASRYAIRANHPMVVAECDGTVYDPLRLTTVAEGAWVRGEIVRGSGIRPPLAIDIEVQGNAIVADRME
jgi:hypothetical protein